VTIVYWAHDPLEFGAVRTRQLFDALYIKSRVMPLIVSCLTSRQRRILPIVSTHSTRVSPGQSLCRIG